MSKEFKTIAEQAAILRSRGLVVEPEDERALLAENYYSVVNGYKEFFLDKTASAERGEDVFIEGSTFKDLYDLFLFDRDLRQVVLGYLIEAEARVRSVSSYVFCSEHPEANAYLDMANYTDRDDYMLGGKRWVSDLPSFLGKLNRKAYGDRHCKGFIKHYRDNHGDVPLWVLVNDLTFGNLSYFFNLQKRSTQNEICRKIGELRGPLPDAGPITPHSMRITLRTLVAFRNICAHDERLFCARVGPVKDITFYHMYVALESILGKEASEDLLEQITNTINSHRSSSALLIETVGAMANIELTDLVKEQDDGAGENSQNRTEPPNEENRNQEKDGGM